MAAANNDTYDRAMATGFITPIADDSNDNKDSYNKEECIKLRILRI